MATINQPCFILECVQLLLSRDAPVKMKNGLGWTVLAEAVSYGHRPTSMCFKNFLNQVQRVILAVMFCSIIFSTEISSAIARTNGETSTAFGESVTGHRGFLYGTKVGLSVVGLVAIVPAVK